MISEVISRTFSNLFSFTTVIGVILFGLVFFLRFAPAALTMIGAKDSEGGGMMARGCGAMILMWLGEAFAVFYLVVAISPKVLGFSDSAHWGLPFAALFGAFGTTLKYLIMGLVLSLIGTFIPIVGRFQIFIYTMMSVAFYRVGYKLARPEGYRIGNDAYKDYFPEFGVSALIIVTCLVLSFVSIIIGASLTKKQFDPEPEKTAQGYMAIGSLLFAIIPIYMYGAWFSLKMQ
jgi:hypothetical protein